MASSLHWRLLTSLLPRVRTLFVVAEAGSVLSDPSRVDLEEDLTSVLVLVILALNVYNVDKH